MMSHPNVARILFADSTDQGQPYFVMDYVQGRPITRYCDDARLCINERIGLFLQVCASSPARAPDGDHPSGT